MELQSDKSSRKRGRPAAFDRATALHAAMIAFWRTGYETTSIATLTDAMGISAPSLYAAFGDKRRLFLEAIQLYAGQPAEAIAATRFSREAARTMLQGAATLFTGAGTPPGCMLASATASGSAASLAEQQAVADIRCSIAQVLAQLIERDVDEGMLPPGTNGPVLAALVVAVVQGMSVLARDGANRASLLAVAEAAMQAWPAKPPE